MTEKKTEGDWEVVDTATATKLMEDVTHVYVGDPSADGTFETVAVTPKGYLHGTSRYCSPDEQPAHGQFRIDGPRYGNAIAAARVASRPTIDGPVQVSTRAYREGWEAIFGRKEEPYSVN